MYDYFFNEHNINGDVMTSKEAWDNFYNSGKISDYLVYVNIKKREEHM